MSSYHDLIPDASNLIESQRSIGYIFETAIADIVDNSISAMANRVDILFNREGKYVAVLDNGNGMTGDELMQAMKYGSTNIYDIREKEDLGRFGLGLKMASFSQCRKLTVISKKNNILSGAIWDLDVVKFTNSWTIEVMNESEIKGKIHDIRVDLDLSGTLVIWENFDKLENHGDFDTHFEEAIDRAEDHLSLVFHRYLEKRKLSIYFNNREIDYVDPFFTSNKATQPLSSDVILENFRFEKIDVKPYIVPYQKRLTQNEKHLLKKYEQNRLTPGLYIYRNYRLIAWGKWFQLVRPSDLANLAKIRIDIPNTMDDLWEIDVKKSQLTIPISLRKQLKTTIIKSIGESEKVYKNRGLKRNNSDLLYVFDRYEKDNRVSYHINMNNPTINQLQENLSDSDNRLLSSLLKQIEEHLPLESIQYDMGSNKQIDIEEDTEDEIYEDIMMLINNQTSNQSKIDLLNTLRYSEMYSKSTKIIEKIESELDD